MSEREEVLREFGVDELVRLLPMPVSESVRTLAEEIVRLRSQLAAVTADRDYYERQVKAGVVRYQPHDCETKAAYGRIYELERERDEARRESVATEMRRLHERAEALRHRAERAERERDGANESLVDAKATNYSLRQRAERAEAEAAYIRRAFRGAVESDALAVTYKTVGSYRAGLLKTINALDTTEPTP